MKTYNDIYLSTRNLLRQSGIEACDLEARILVAGAAGKTVEHLLRDLKLYTTAEVENRALDYTARRLKGEPVAYITGSWQFYGMSTAFPQLTKTWHLDQLKDKVEELQDMDLGAYTDDSVTQLKDALSKAEALIQREDSTKAQLKEAYGQLDEAEQGLVLKSDKRALAELIKKAEQLSEQEYTAASWTVLQDVLRQAKAVMDDAEADQAQIDEAAAALQEAIDQLQKVKDPVDTGTDHAKLIYGLLSVGMLALSGNMMLKKKENKA